MADRLELAAALLVTASVVYLHIEYLTHSGPLWRDEINSIVVATRSGWSDVWKSLEFESFPMLPFALLRIWWKLGMAHSDFGWRILGFIAGILILVALWVNQRLLNSRVPLLSLVLLAMNPTVLHWGDSLRAYGLGAAFLLLTFGGVGKLMEFPTFSRWAAATIFALFSVQCLYGSAVILLGISLASAVACMYCRQWDKIAICVSPAGIAALSLFPYLGIIKRAQEHYIIHQVPELTPMDLWKNFLVALGPYGDFGERSLSVVFLYLMICFFAVLVALLRSTWSFGHRTSGPHALTLYSLATIIFSTGFFVVFSIRLRFGPQPWYFIGLLSVIAASTEAILTIWSYTRTRRIGVLVLVLTLAGMMFGPMREMVSARQTRIDQIAHQLGRHVGERDLIVVSNWFQGVSFNRYYRGIAPWTTIPPLEDHGIHRYDLVKQRVMTQNPIDPLLSRITETLQSGNRVWIVGPLIFPAKDLGPGSAPSAPNGSTGWWSTGYTTAWAQQVGYVIMTRATRCIKFRPVHVERIKTDEDPTISMCEVSSGRLLEEFSDLGSGTEVDLIRQKASPKR